MTPFIRADEARFTDLEMRYHSEYRFTGGPPLPQFVKSSNRTVQQITQGDLYWLDYRDKGTTVGGQATDNSHLTAYDGSETRNWIQNRYGNLHIDRWESPLLLRPHRLISWAAGRSASEYLNTGFAGTKPELPEGTGVVETIDRQADDLFLGRRCIVLQRRLVWTEPQRDKDVPPCETIDHLWICPNANYLPLKAEKAEVTKTGSKVTWRIQVDALDQLERGVFFPKHVTEVVYDASGAEQNSRTWTFDSVKLRPRYAIERFRGVAFPKGALVYRLKGGAIISSYTVAD